MLYFKPVNATNNNGLPVPYTAPVKTAIESQWYPANDRNDSHFEYWAYVSLHGIIIWEADSYNKGHLKDTLEAVMRRVANLAARNAEGVFDLYNVSEEEKT